MYEEFFGHFGLEGNPFHVSPDPKRFYSTVAHDEALLQLVFGIESRKGLLVLTGEPGTGKTTILQYLLDWLRQYRYSTAYVFHTLVPSTDLLHLILRDFGIVCPSRNKSDVLGALKDWLVKRDAEGDCPVIIIDEAQALATRALDELQMLLNEEKDNRKLVQLVLAGQPELEAKLHQRKLAQLRQRIAGHCRLRPLTLDETTGYIGSRLVGAGARGAAAFPEEAVADIFRYAKGIPRVVNLFCEHAMLAAYADKRDAINCSDVKRVARQFEFTEEIDQEPFESDMFCRLIPLPKLSAEAGRTAGRGAPGAGAEMESIEAALSAVERVAAEELSPRIEPPLDVEATENAPPVRGSSKADWGRVAKSFASDGQEFVRGFVGWLGRPVKIFSVQKIRRWAGMAQGWLRVPIGSTRRFPSEAPKHS